MEEYLDLKETIIDENVIKLIPSRIVCHYKIMPIEIIGKCLKVATADLHDLNLMDEIQLLTGYEIKPVLADEKDILEAIRKYYGIGADTIRKMVETSKREEKPIEIKEEATTGPVIKLVNQIIMEASSKRATDLHIEPFENDLQLRYRIDGILYNVTVSQDLKRFQQAITTRIKIMADMNIAEKRLPQDGRIKCKIDNKEFDLRISILPTPFGESVQLRFLSSNILLGLEQLGFTTSNIGILQKLIEKPHGILFLTGPTGSGKTTTLYTCLSAINTEDKKIITVEDPIEYQLKGITQIQTHPKIGLTFAEGLRSMLRHDPDVMMVGEVRDYETAEIAIRSALTGHIVFSTLHTNDAASGVTRLLDIGIEPYLCASSVEAFIAQRLVRLLCSKCKEEKNIPQSIVEQKRGEFSKSYIAKGCELCNFTGYQGRTAISEFLIVYDEIKELIMKKGSATEIKRKAISCGMKTLRQDGLLKVKDGITSIEEIFRVTPEDANIGE